MVSASDTQALGAGTLSAAVSAVLEDCLYNIISDITLKAHREEKISRMQSAAIIAQQKKDKVRSEATPGEEIKDITTPGATINEEDRIYLHGNPLSTTVDVLCPTCRLPRLIYPTTGKSARPKDESKKYCEREPYIDKDGCDIYGKSLVLEKPSKKKSATQKPKANDSRSGSESPGSPGGPSASSSNKQSDKPQQTSIPSGKCPNCPRYLAFTRMAQHMDRCIGISARQSSKNALSKMGSNNTPRETSRASTPKPSVSQSQSQSAVGPTALSLSQTADASGSAASATISASANASQATQGLSQGKKRKLEKGSDDDEEGLQSFAATGAGTSANANASTGASDKTPNKKKKVQAKKEKEGKNTAAAAASGALGTGAAAAATSGTKASNQNSAKVKSADKKGSVSIDSSTTVGAVSAASSGPAGVTTGEGKDKNEEGGTTGKGAGSMAS